MFKSYPDASFWPRRWLALAVFALAISGIFSIILVVSRTPQLIALFPWMKELFSVSLVIHVDLSVLVWFLAMTGFMWSLLLQQYQPRPFPFAQAASWGCVLAAVCCMAASPLTGEWEVVKSNYIPVITNALFFLGLALLLSGMLMAMLLGFSALPKRENTIDIGTYATLPLMLIALMCFVGSAMGIPSTITGLAFYENLFWAGGHMLQFVYVQIMLVAWVILAGALGFAAPTQRVLTALFLLQPVVAASAFVPYALYEVMSQEHMDFFTLQMNIALGISGGVLGLWYVYHFLRQPHLGRNGVDAALKTSMLLFVVGGLFGAFINGPNVRIPAHYHGSIVAVTLALMGLAYYLLPRLGGRDVAQWRSAMIQPWLYAIGQLLHISGLAISGGYGVLRKAVGDVGSGGWEVKAALGMMGVGGLLAIAGGLLFVIIMVRGFRRCRV